MKLRFALPLTLALASPAAALDLDAMTPAEKTAFGAQVRAYLLENPEVLQEAIGVLQDRQQQAQAGNDAAMVRAFGNAIFDDGHSFVGGNPDGDITVVEFMDYRCGFCKRAFPEVQALVAGDGNIRYIIKEFPILGEQSVLASRFAIATQRIAGDATYKEVHNTLMEFNGDITAQALVRVADALGLDMDAITSEMNSDAVTTIIAENRALADAMQITGTPTFVFEDQLVRGYVPGAQMEQLVAALRAE
ncbi:DsbA family protein [Yoonia sp.]|uniref:DsbA family protein n=1 Tax=Yoonia sp. TaxID=2212373 RepID=UPI0019FCBD15|nr:DsbA family protein [Yoonia sp.]MBE0413055.1 DsbA family protein [Yoonia sp.]